MKRALLVLFIVFPFIMTTCPQQSKKNQGIAGIVLWEAGNMMPTFDRKGSEATPKSKPVQREVLVYTPIKRTECSGKGSLYDTVQGKLVASAESTEEGAFFIPLDTGHYSVLIKEGDQYFASVMNGDGILNPVEVKNNEITEMKIRVNYKAIY